MDSCNSGSMQSSSSGNNGGEEEYDSRADQSISAFFNSNSNPTSHVGPMPNPPTQPPLPSSSVYHDLSFTNFIDHPSLAKSPNPPSFNTNTNYFFNLDMPCTDLGNLMASSSSRGTTAFQAMHAAPTAQESVQIASNDQNINSNNNSNVGRNPKKRSRASRRAPTTVLTTDTSNFRAMVQEFTGIPAPPFTSFPRSRLDLFGTASTLRSGLGHFDQSTHLLRPFAQKVQPSISSLYGSLKADPIASTTITTTTASNSQFGYQMQQQSQNLLNTNMQNHVLNFQSFLQGPPRYPLSSTSIIGSKQPQGSSSQGNIQEPTLEDQFGMSIHGQVQTHNLGGLQNMVSSEGWGHGDGDHRGLLRSTSHGGVDVTNNNGNKLNYGAASANVHADDKGPENVAPRSEGMVESWICSSD